MIEKYISRQQWEAKLRRSGCEPLEGKGKLNTAEWWKAENGLPFTVPVEENGHCEFWALQTICTNFGMPVPKLEEEDKIVRMLDPPPEQE